MLGLIYFAKKKIPTSSPEKPGKTEKKITRAAEGTSYVLNQ